MARGPAAEADVVARARDEVEVHAGAEVADAGAVAGLERRGLVAVERAAEALFEGLDVEAVAAEEEGRVGEEPRRETVVPAECRREVAPVEPALVAGVVVSDDEAEPVLTGVEAGVDAVARRRGSRSPSR